MLWSVSFSFFIPFRMDHVHLPSKAPPLGSLGIGEPCLRLHLTEGESWRPSGLDTERGEHAGRSLLNSAELAGPTCPSTRTDYPLAAVWIATKLTSTKVDFGAVVRDGIHHHCVQISPVFRNRWQRASMYITCLSNEYAHFQLKSIYALEPVILV